MTTPSYRGRPRDLMLERSEVHLPPPACDPFTDSSVLAETYFFEAVYDALRGKVGLLFGLLGALCQEPDANVGLLIASDVSEFGWAAEQHDIPPWPGFWTVLLAEFVGAEEGTRVVVPPLPGWRPVYSDTAKPLHRYRLALNPNSELVVAFYSAVYLVGHQPRQVENSATTFSFDDETEWHAACEWPR